MVAIWFSCFAKCQPCFALFLVKFSFSNLGVVPTPKQTSPEKSKQSAHRHARKNKECVKVCVCYPGCCPGALFISVCLYQSVYRYWLPCCTVLFLCFGGLQRSSLVKHPRAQIGNTILLHRYCSCLLLIDLQQFWKMVSIGNGVKSTYTVVTVVAISGLAALAVSVIYHQQDLSVIYWA